MPAERSYYEILGLPKTAALADIKKRYRELARQYHPDVNQSKLDVAKRFAEITTAYKTLSHPDERKLYDIDLTMRERRAASAAARTASVTFPGAASSAPPRPGTAPGARPAAAPSSASAAAADTARLVSEAQNAFVRGKFVEARALCEQVLRRDRRNAQAYEILGDVYRLQGKTDEAVNAYTMALQLNPRNQTVMERVERLARSGGPSASRVFYDNRAARGGFGGASASRAGDRNGTGDAQSRDKRPLKVLLGGMIGYGLAFLLILWLAVSEHRPISNAPAYLAPIATWSVPLLSVMGLSGIILGFTMAATSAVRHIGDELILAGGGGRGPSIPLGLVLIVLSFVSFYAAALLYALIGILQESLTPSMLRVFGVVTGVVLLLTAVYEPGRVSVLLHGGNIVFLALVIGWFLGDFFRSDF